MSDSHDASPEATELASATTFADLGLSDTLLQAITGAGYSVPTPIQAETIPLLISGRDVLGQAQTGTGKTAAFALPMLQQIDVQQRQTQILVLTPTRELAIQVAESFQRYGAGMKGVGVVPIYGGQDYQIQFRQLDRGAHVVVGTPGRVIDHMRRGSLQLDALRGLVLDEADEMLRMGFAEDVQWVLSQSPAERQIALFSATLPPAIRQIAQQHLRNPAEITIPQQTATADTVRQRFVIAAPHHKQAVLARLLEAEPTDGVIVFVKMKSTTEPLAEFLAQHGHRTAALSGDVAQKSRERIVENIRSGKVDVIVATDVAARGLDVQRISHVVNYDLPFDSEAYVHRIGRTGRAGRSGEAILFVHPREQRTLSRLERATGQAIEPMEVPSNRLINTQRVAHFHDSITKAMEHPDLESYTSILQQYQTQHADVPLQQIAAALAVLARGDQPLLISDQLKPAAFAAGAGSNGARDARRGQDRPQGRRRGSTGGDEPMRTYRIEVGRKHQVKPANIVGAIANEAGIDSAFIGSIQIFDEFSTVDLPDGMPREIFHTLGNVWVSGRQLKLSLADAVQPAERRPQRLQEGAAFKPKSKTFKPKSKAAKPGGKAFAAKPKTVKAKTTKAKGSTKPKAKPKKQPVVG